MSPADALRAATVNAAALLNMSEAVGALEAGQYADLIALDGDPLASTRELEKVTFVMKGGASFVTTLAHDRTVGSSAGERQHRNAVGYL